MLKKVIETVAYVSIFLEYLVFYFLLSPQILCRIAFNSIEEVIVVCIARGKNIGQLLHNIYFVYGASL